MACLRRLRDIPRIERVIHSPGACADVDDNVWACRVTAANTSAIDLVG